MGAKNSDEYASAVLHLWPRLHLLRRRPVGDVSVCERRPGLLASA